MVQYVHQRTLQRLTLGAIETEADERGKTRGKKD
jgi:hypothetical protein